MRRYKPTYPTRYTPDPRPPVAPCYTHTRDQTSWVDATHPFHGDRTPAVIPAAGRYNRAAKSVRGIIADSRISGDCRRTWFDVDGGQGIVRTELLSPKSPYQTAGPGAEARALMTYITGVHTPQNKPDMYCGVQSTDIGFDDGY